MSDLVVWLSGQYDQAETDASTACAGPTDDGEWKSGLDAGWGAQNACRVEGSGITIYDEGGHSEAQAAFIAAHDPAWRLADVALKRQILADHVMDDFGASSYPEPDDPPPICTRCKDYPDSVEWPCRTVRLLAAEFAGRDGYLEDWKP